MISVEKKQALEARMQKLGILESDLDENFIRGTGHGGQKINKTNSTVYLKHRPTGMEVKCQQTRSQSENRFFARRILTDKIEAMILGKKSAVERQKYKIKKQKQKRSKRAKEKMLAEKHHRSAKKAQRERPSNYD